MTDVKKESMFAAAVNCIDGRTHEALISWIKENFNVSFVDLITEPGAVKYLNKKPTQERDHILKKIRVSLKAHHPGVLIVAAHKHCAGNPVEDSIQKQQLNEAHEFLKENFPYLEVVAIWLGENFVPERIKYCLTKFFE